MTIIFHRVLLALGILLPGAFAADQGGSPAHRALEHFRRGANFGNYLEVPPGQTWAVQHGVQDIENVAREGFDHIRLPVGWHHYAGPGPEFKIEGPIFSKVDAVVTNALARGLSVLINIHHFEEFTSDPAGQTNKFYALWKQIAEHYSSQPARLAFELINEPKDAALTEVMNPIYADAVRIIRKSNPGRTIFIGPGRWNSLDEVPKLRLPDDDNLIVTVHSYEPFLFTHQGASWTGSSVMTTGIQYPGPPSEPAEPHPRAAAENRWITNWFHRYNTLPPTNNPSGPVAFVARMDKVAAWAAENNRPIHVGEFGAYQTADRESRARFYSDMRRTAERLGFGWAIWDWKAGFKYWQGDEPAAGMRAALFGNN